ncbi:hypothetical protein LEP1GSC115_1324 [Leptospira interrogans serovar Australis str. 200703203]|uniref:Alpha/beta hydrolase domain protein n=1 Tax=Leptospira interrogans serovar Australis str. 200703203 TaxID=1085541 RepID=N1UW41_LEPIR|nr:hypothetical protein LEP1GSC115_1324 [Leptospira interrogans serovar Australis str. 200703203]
MNLKKLKTPKFTPSGILKSPFIQTALASLKWNLPKKMTFLKNTEKMILDVEKGVRLEGYLSKQKNQKPKGFLILLHGWEGSVNSTYILKTSNYFYEKNMIFSFKL